MHDLERSLLELSDTIKNLASQSHAYLPPHTQPERNVLEISRSGNSVYGRCGFWLEPDGSIHLTMPGVHGFHVAVNRDPERPNGHPTLFKRLADCLREQGAPSPVEL